MSQMIFVNLPVTDLAKSTAFYAALGFNQNPQFSDENASCMMLSDQINVMLLKHDFWRTFTKRDIPDAHQSAQVLLAISRESKDAVNAMASLAGANGGTADPNPPQEYDFMFSRSFADPDGHIWEPAWMNMDAAPGA